VRQIGGRLAIDSPAKQGTALEIGIPAHGRHAGGFA
jgi:signal transduction histidine kinase